MTSIKDVLFNPDRVFFSSGEVNILNSKPKPTNGDPGIRLHWRISKYIWNFFAIFGVCSKVIDYKLSFSNETLYLNEKSFKYWLVCHKAIQLGDNLPNSDIRIKELVREAIRHAFEPI